MNTPPDAPPANDPDLGWTEDGLPRSGRFGDLYFSAQDGLAETREVYLRGCGLPEAWRGRQRFTVGELGFGTGLNVLALLDLWRRERPPGATLHIFSVEAFPLKVEDARRALGHWPELGELSQTLNERWPPRTPGFHRIDFPAHHAVLDLAVMDVADALEAWGGRADAWFLDGFSPATNPQMWRDEVLTLVAARSAPGARAASFTVAGAVRRGLAAQGFDVAKRPGFGRKNERLEAVFSGVAPPEPKPGRVAIVGAGIAGASLARAFRALGQEPALYDREGAGAGASGGPAALVTPRFDAGGGVIADLFAQAFDRAVTLYRQDAPGAVLRSGVVQLEHQDRDARRFDQVAAQTLWEPGAVMRLSPDEASQALGEPVARGGLWLRDGLAIEPLGVLGAWLSDVRQVRGDIARIERVGELWRLLDAGGQVVGEAETVCLAAGWGAVALIPDAPLTPARGQASLVTGVSCPTPFAWGGYVVPTRDGVLIGATQDRGETATDTRPADNERNLESLARTTPALADLIGGAPIEGWAAIRAITPDRLPLAGALASGLFVLGGLGARGFTAAPVLAEHIAALATGTPSPLPSALAARVHPRRFPR
jgi:tRNA 5-methylaminomethyl-2-thiouridine biosynthesis bifunctional protein